MSIAPTVDPTRTAGANRPPLRMSYEEYLAWDYEGGLTEWVDGEVVIHMPAKDEHQRVQDFLNRLVGLFVRLFKYGKVRSAPYVMRCVRGGNGREPDLLFVATDRLMFMTRDELDGPADLAVEIISKDSVTRDRDEKFQEYQNGGVREYWLIDPRPGRLRADFYVLDALGRYQPVPLGADNVYHATVLPGFWLDSAWLWQDDPDPLRALAQIVGAERVIAALHSAAE